MKQKLNAYYFGGLSLIVLIAAGIPILFFKDYFNSLVVLAGVFVLATVSILSFMVAGRSVGHENPNRFVRGVMLGTMLKFFFCIIAVVVWLFLYKETFDKSVLFLFMAYYFVFTVFESILLSNEAKKSVAQRKLDKSSM